MKTLLKNCRLVSPDVDIPLANIEVTDGFNTVTVENLSPGDNPRGVPWFFVNYIVVRPK